MNDITLPKEWIESTLVEVCHLNPKNFLPDDSDVGFLPMSGVPTNFGEQNKFEVKKWSEVKKGYTHFADGDTIFAKITPCFENGKASIIEKFPAGHGSGSTEYFVLRPIGGLVNPKILLGLVRTNEFLREGAANMSGSVGHKRVPKEFVENFVFPLAPLAEQQQIAQKLDELLAQVDIIKTRLDAIPKILKRFRQSVLSAAVSGRLTEDWRRLSSNLKHKKFVLQEIIESEYEKKSSVEKRRVKSAKSEEWFFSCVDKIPSSWIDANLIDATKLITCGVAKKPDYINSGVPFLSAQNSKPFSPNLNGIKHISIEDFKKFTVGGRPEKGDVLYSRVGANFGEACQIPWNFDFAIYVSLTLIKPIKSILNDSYLTMYLNSIDGILQSRGGILGSGIQNLNVESVRKYRIPLPIPEEQVEIVRRVEKLFAYADQIEKRVKDAKTRVNHLTQSILAKAFKGELTVEWRAQNPELISGENSAAALLERIKTEREATKLKKKTG